MKKSFILLAILALMQMAGAQAQEVKSINAAKSAVEKTYADTQNPKKNAKIATWMKYGQALIDAYNASAGSAWVGMSQQELKLLSSSEKATSEESVVVGGQTMTKMVYDTKNYYVGPDGSLAFVEITNPVVEDALGKAVEAYKKAHSLDNGSKSKDIANALSSISVKYVGEAFAKYSLGEYADASVQFENAAVAKAQEPCSLIDSNSVYNTAFTAYLAENYDRAREFFGKCLDIQYYGEGGDVYAKLADIAERKGEKAESKSILEEAFTKFPQSQSILVGLINYYVSSGEDTGRLFDLLAEAMKNDPTNASLWYVKGNIHKNLGQIEDALASYDKCSEVDPTYTYGYIGKGIYHYEKAIELQDKAANELDDAKYMVLLGEFETSLKSCIAPFEKAYELSSDAEIKSSIAEYLKNACFRFRNEDPSYQEKYNKYAGK